ncbi:MAG: helix-turn-helix domain-containing protein [Candidatus Aminicenantes bacterium]|nr:helix-turn-helix domain-containing protein [Candidatus Aminicenantes bacterium]
MKDQNADRYITIQSAAEMLGCTDRHVLNLIREGEIKAIKIGGRAMRVSEYSLKEFIKTHVVNPEDFYAPEEPPDPDPPPPLKVVKSKWMNR